MSIIKRWIIFWTGIACQSIGIALVVKSLLGTSPISSIPYVLSLSFPLTFGQTTFIINIMFFIGEILLLKKKFDKLQYLQVPVIFVFAALIDVAMSIFSDLIPEMYIYKMAILLIGAAFVSLGIALQVIANVLMLAGEGIVKAISDVFKVEFGNIKTVFDCTLVISAALWSYIDFGTIEGIREGTLISALITGSVARFFIKHLSLFDKNGNRKLYLHI